MIATHWDDDVQIRANSDCLKIMEVGQKLCHFVDKQKSCIKKSWNSNVQSLIDEQESCNPNNLKYLARKMALGVVAAAKE